MTVEEWDRVMEINMRGVFLTCQAAARSMKAGVVIFTRVLAMELAKQRNLRYARSSDRTTTLNGRSSASVTINLARR